MTASEALQKFKANNERYSAMESTSEIMDKMFGTGGIFLDSLFKENEFSEDGHDTINKFFKLVSEEMEYLQIQNKRLSKIITDGK